MAEEMKLTNEEAEALDKIDNVLQKGKTTASAEGASELCDTYHSLRDELLIFIKLLKKFGGSLGAKAAAALEFLMSLADAVCPVS